MTKQSYSDPIGEATPADQSVPVISDEMLRAVAAVAKRSLARRAIVTIDGEVMGIWKAYDVLFFRQNSDRRLRIRWVYPGEMQDFGTLILDRRLKYYAVGPRSINPVRMLVLLTRDGVCKIPVPNGAAREIRWAKKLADTEANCLALLEFLESARQTVRSPKWLRNSLRRVRTRGKVLANLPPEEFESLRTALLEAQIEPEGLA